MHNLFISLVGLWVAPLVCGLLASVQQDKRLELVVRYACEFSGTSLMALECRFSCKKLYMVQVVIMFLYILM